MRAWPLSLLFVSIAFAVPAAARVQLSPQEFKAMEPACQAIGMGEIDGRFWAEVLKNSPILDKPENAMAKDAGWFHHYCWGKLSKFRYYSAKTAEQRKSGIHVWRSEMQFIVDWTGERGITWTYMPVIHKEIAESYLFEKNYAQAIAAGEKALALDRDYIPVYPVIADAYVGAGQRDRALDTVSEGLRRAPDSRALKRRYQAFGGKLPYPEALPAAPARDAAAAPPATNAAPVIAPPAPDETRPQAGDAGTAGEPPQPNGNPYCRFCP